VPRPGDHVSFLPGMRPYRVAELIELGISSIHDIPPDYPRSPRQRRACNTVQAAQPWFGEGLKEDLSALAHPLFFMDFETVYPALPRHSGMRPYDHIPFQWSVHVQRQPGAELEHFEFLAAGDRDPRPAFLASLCEVLGQSGHIVVYNRPSESEHPWQISRGGCRNSKALSGASRAGIQHLPPQLSGPSSRGPFQLLTQKSRYGTSRIPKYDMNPIDVFPAGCTIRRLGQALLYSYE